MSGGSPDPSRFRSEFPVLELVAYLNAGTEGPVPRRALDAVGERVSQETERGRCGRPYFEELFDLALRARSGYAQLLGCSDSEVALTGSTTDGVNTVLSGLDLGEGDEILTSDQEHPGLLAPLGHARRRHGVTIRVAPFTALAEHVTPGRTRLVACSHVSWVGGQVVDAQSLAATGVPILLDGAQGLGAVPVDVRKLGCHFYAASGQKWLCGPEGSGCLFVAAERLDDILVPWPGYGSLADPQRPLDIEPAEGARRFDHGFPIGIRNSWILASLEVLAEAGWRWIHERAAALSERLARRLDEAGLDVQPRGRSTLVSWRVSGAQAEVERLSGAGFVVRSIPGWELIRASVGAWSSEEEVDRLVEAAARRASP